MAGLVRSECEELEIRGIDVLNKKMEVIVVYMLSLMYELCRSKDPSEIEWCVDQMRGHLITCMESGEITSFPTKQCVRIPDPMQVSRVQLHCVCRLPERRGQKMVLCSSCNRWFHQKCLDIPNNIFIKKASKTCNYKYNPTNVYVYFSFLLHLVILYLYYLVGLRILC